jgi:dihydrofolate reductase
MSFPSVTLIAAVDKNYALDYDDRVPWHLPKDLRFFRRVTTGHPVIMGRRTYETLGKPLVDRLNIVLSRDPSYDVTLGTASPSSDVLLANSPQQAMEFARSASAAKVFVIGGGEIYDLFLEVASEVMLTEVDTVVDEDHVTASFPTFDTTWPVSIEYFTKDARHAYDFSIRVYALPGAYHGPRSIKQN